jgi:hypothetical protein
MLILTAEEREDKFTWCVLFSERKLECKGIKIKVHASRKHKHSTWTLLFKLTRVSRLTMRTVYVNTDIQVLNISA